MGHPLSGRGPRPTRAQLFRIRGEYDSFVATQAELVDVNEVIVPLLSSARAEEVTQRVRQAIALGLLHDGQQLPAESVFASQLGVSTMTLRDALANLREQGLVETRRGRSGGTFVTRPPTIETDGMWARLRETSVTALRDLADEHAAVAGMAAYLAAERASESSKPRLSALVDQLAQADNLGSRIRADSRFHVDVAAFSHSERLTQREVALQGEVGDLLWLPHRLEQGLARAVAEHRGIIEAVSREDAEGARHLAEAHVHGNLQRLSELHRAAARSGPT